MSTAVEPADNTNEIDPPFNRGGDDEGEEKEGPKLFSDYCKPECMHEILQKRWGIFFLFSTLVYIYHFLSIIIGMDKYVHYSRFTGCKDTTSFKDASAVFDTALLLVLIFHIIEWVRQTVLITTILVGVPWLPLYFLLSLNVPFGLIVMIFCMAVGFGADETCITNQPGRAMFCQLQIVTFFLYLIWNQHPMLMFKLGDLMFKPTDTDEEGTLLY